MKQVNEADVKKMIEYRMKGDLVNYDKILGKIMTDLGYKIDEQA